MAKADPDRFADLFAFCGQIDVRRMFGGEGLFNGGLMIGLVMNERIFLKTDTETRKAFLAEKMKPFSFRKGGKTIQTAYYAIPDRLYDDSELFAQWARRAEAVARAGSAKKKTVRPR